MELNRRTLVRATLAGGASLAAATLPDAAAAQAQQGGTPPARFGLDDVARRARDLANAPFEAKPPALPDALAKLDFDAWRDIRFRPDKAFLAGNNSLFRLHLFHLGHLYPRPVTVNTIRDGIPTPIPYSANLFDYGRTKLDRPLPVNLGFAGFRLHFPLNSPDVFDEVISFIGASYFRFLGRGQRYGLSARALAVGAGTNEEEFPFFREFWIETPDANAEQVTIYALLDGASVTGAFRFDVNPGAETFIDVSAQLFPRRSGAKFGLAPLTSMFFIGENDRRFTEDFRPELHDSDGLLMHLGNGEWVWRPLHNPTLIQTSSFMDTNGQGYGLLQRDRAFDHYEDLELAYEARPSYWVEPRGGGWGDGRVELVELPTTDETNDNIVASWVPAAAPEPGRPYAYGYRLAASLDMARLSPNARVINTFSAPARALGSAEPLTPGTRRFIIDFAGGDLDFYIRDPGRVEIVPSTSAGRITRSFLMPNAPIQGFRAVIDVQLDPGQSTDLRAFLRTKTRALTETWTYPWRAD